MTTPEGKVKAKVNRKIKALNEKYPGAIWSFMPVQSGYGVPALDYLWCVAGHFVAVETKADAKCHLSERQKFTRSLIEAAGGTVYVIYDDATLNTCVEEVEDGIRATREGTAGSDRQQA